MFYQSGRLIVRSPWSLRRKRGHQVEVTLKGRGAFPPGHPSTRAAITLMAGAPLEGARVLDVGCGCGVLGLCALALGAELAIGCDILKKPISETKKNMEANPHLPGLVIFRGSTEAVGSPFDLVVANLPFEVQLEKIEEYPRLLAPGGTLILSGFGDHEFPKLVSLLSAKGLETMVNHFREDSSRALAGGPSSRWASLTAVFRPA